jgi:hypothetical protein
MRLLITLGLLIASFFSANSFSSIFDSAPFVSPKIVNLNVGPCSFDGSIVEWSDCKAKLQPKFDSVKGSLCGDPVITDTVSSTGRIYREFNYKLYSCATPTSTRSGFIGSWGYSDAISSEICPPDSNPNNTHGYDSNYDGKIDKCFDPSVLSDLTECDSAPDFLGNSSGKTGEICMTQPSSGAQCGYLAGSNGSMVQSQSVSCYDDTPVDKFGGDPIPDIASGQCVPFGTGFACSAKPEDVCYGGACPNNCGTLGKGGDAVFVCFNDEPKLPDPTNPTDPTNDIDPTQGDPSDPTPVDANDSNNPVSRDISAMTNRLGDLITLTRNKGNDVIYAVNKQTGQLVNSMTQSNGVLADISQKLSNPNGDLVAAVDRTTGEVVSVMRESQVKLAELGDNIFLTKDIAQGTLETAKETKQEITKGFDNIIDFMKSVDTPDPVTGKSEMDVLAETNSDGFAEMQTLLNALLDSPGIKGPGSGTGETPTPEPEPEPEKLGPNPNDFGFDPSSAKARMDSAFDTAIVDADILLLKENMINTFNNIKGTFKSSFSINVGSSGALPSLGVLSYDGNSTDVSLAPYTEQFNWIGLALFFMTTVSCLIIIFR